MEIEPTDSQVSLARQEFLKDFINIWGVRKLPLEILRFEVFKRLMEENPNFNWSKTRLKIWKILN